MRRVQAEPTPGVTATDRFEDELALRVYVPTVRKSSAAILWIHGGGLVMGKPVVDDRICGLFSGEVGVPLVSVDYRLAPEHPFPAGLDDSVGAWDWLQRAAASLGVDPTRVVIAGQSAGGGIAASLVQYLLDRRGVGPLAQILLCPMLDDRTAADRKLDEINHRGWNNRMNRFGWRSYLGVDPGSAELAEYASAARRQNLLGLPPAWVGVGDIDLFYPEDRDYVARLRAAAVPVEFEVAPGAPHGFEGWAWKSAVTQRYLASAVEWLRSVTVG